jgi:hypothetical protein
VAVRLLGTCRRQRIQHRILRLFQVRNSKYRLRPCCRLFCLRALPAASYAASFSMTGNRQVRVPNAVYRMAAPAEMSTPNLQSIAYTGRVYY